jgi:hypothetical protein
VSKLHKDPLLLKVHRSPENNSETLVSKKRPGGYVLQGQAVNGAASDEQSGGLLCGGGIYSHHN